MKVTEKEMFNEDKDTQYFEYLKNISILGRWYRMLWVYPIIRRWSKKNILDVGCGIGVETTVLQLKPNLKYSFKTLLKSLSLS